jgi:mannose-6-phosphate isomerase-like protein (cupin superfamily)
MCTKIKKGWGHELILESNDLYCFKELHFDKKGHQSSMHFHKEKDETWTVLKGAIKLELMDMTDATTRVVIVNHGGVIRIKPMTPHQVTSLEDDTVIMEVSTKDSVEDNHRIIPGDSQKIALYDDISASVND